MASQKVLFDAIVIGAGIQGCFTAYHLAKHERRVLLLEQFFLPHSRGSSHGQSRIIRRAYPEDFYTQMMEECYLMWAQLEREAGQQLHRFLWVLGEEFLEPWDPTLRWQCHEHLKYSGRDTA